MESEEQEFNANTLEAMLGSDILKAIQRGYIREERISLFLCHSHIDKRFVCRLSRDLEQFHISVWRDQCQLEPGDSLHKCIGKAIEKSAYIGVVLSPSSVNSVWCQSELEQALTKEKRTGEKSVLPFLYRRVKIPPFLEGRLYLNFSKSYYVALSRLVAFLLEIPTTAIVKKLYETNPKSVEDIQRLIYSLANQSPIIKVLSPKTFSKIRAALQEADISIPKDSFKISSRFRSKCICFDSAFPVMIDNNAVGYVFSGQANTERESVAGKPLQPRKRKGKHSSE